MNASQLTADELRLLTYMRSSATRIGQHLDPKLAQESLKFSPKQMLVASRGLEKHGLAELCQWRSPYPTLVRRAFLNRDANFSDIRLTQTGWDFLSPPKTDKAGQSPPAGPRARP